MRLSISRLRGVLIAGAVLLVMVVGAFVGRGRYRSLMLYRRLIKRSGVTLTHDTNGFTTAQSLQGRTVFTLHAAKATQLAAGKWALHDAELTLFDHAGKAADHVRASEIDYDEKAEVARADGVVDMDLLPPEGLAKGGRAPVAGGTDAAKRAAALDAAALRAAPAQAVHVKTSGLVYRRKLGIAVTEQRVDFAYGGMQCTAVGAEFDAGNNRLRLRSEVRMEGVTHGKPLHIAAASGEMDRDDNVATLERPAMTSGEGSAGADRAVLHLRQDGSIEQLQAGDHVVLRSMTQEFTAARLDAALNAQTLPERAKLSGGVVMSGTNPLRPMHGSAATVDAVFNAQGVPALVTGDGGAKLSMADMRPEAHGITRSMEGQRVVATFKPGQRRGSAQLSEVRATGDAHAAGESIAAAPHAGTGKWLLKSTQVAGEDLHLVFATGGDGKAQPRTLEAQGHTLLRQDGPGDAQQSSTGDHLQVTFGNDAKAGPSLRGGLGVDTAVQQGHVIIHSRAAARPGSAEQGAGSSGIADKALYDGATQRLTLTGGVRLDGDRAEVSAPVVVLDQATQDVEATEGVQATLEADRQASAEKDTPVTHVLAESAHLVHSEKLAEFRGSAAQPARLWQVGSQVEAATLLFDGAKRTFSARPTSGGELIHALLAAAPRPVAAGTAAPPSLVHVASKKMDYNDLLREATFSGEVRMQAAMGDVKAERGVVFLTPAARQPTAVPAPAQVNPLGGSVQRAILSGKVEIQQPGRSGHGEQLLYNAGTGQYVLTGTAAQPPYIVDEDQGDVTGETLVFADAGSTIVVAGATGTKGSAGRVRTDLSVRSKKDERQ